jgi:hypothetical protein
MEHWRWKTALERSTGKFWNLESHPWNEISTILGWVGKIIQNSEDCKVHKTHTYKAWKYTLRIKTSPLFSLKIWQKPTSSFYTRRLLNNSGKAPIQFPPLLGNLPPPPWKFGPLLGQNKYKWVYYKHTVSLTNICETSVLRQWWHNRHFKTL